MSAENLQYMGHLGTQKATHKTSEHIKFFNYRTIVLNTKNSYLHILTLTSIYK